MGRIFCIMGKSSSGKDTIYKRLMEQSTLQLKKIIPYTTRPVREGEQDGVEYYFCNEERVKTLENQGRIIELRAYDTIHGIWKYFTVDDHQIDLKSGNYLMIGTLEAYEKIRAYFGEENVIPIYIETDDGLRLLRALTREQQQSIPKYAEMCRRFLADEQDFSEEQISRAGIQMRFKNENIEQVQSEIEKYIELRL